MTEIDLNGTLRIPPIDFYRYGSYEEVVEDVLVETTEIKKTCPAHGEWWFGRIGETNRFKCLHNDHQGGIGNPDFRSDQPCRR